MSSGKAYARHIGLLDTYKQMMCFDNEFFGMTEHETTQMDPPQRVTLEVCYDALYRGGWNRKKLNGTEMCCVYGTANGEFESHALQQCHARIDRTTRHNVTLGCTAARFQFCFGMQGRCATIE